GTAENPQPALPWAVPSPLKIVTSEALVGLQVLRLGPGHDFRRQRRCRRSFVPSECFQVIAHELFVEAGLAPARAVLVGGPEAGRIRREHLIDQDELALEQSELELGVCNENSPLPRII